MKEIEGGKGSPLGRGNQEGEGKAPLPVRAGAKEGGKGIFPISGSGEVGGREEGNGDSLLGRAGKCLVFGADLCVGDVGKL